MTPPNEFRVALVGCGRISGNHFDAIAKLDGVSVSGVCDVVEARAQAAGDGSRWVIILDAHLPDGDALELGIAIRATPGFDAVKLLLEIGMVESKGEGQGLRLTEKLVSSGESIRAVFVHNLQASMSELGAKALFDADALERDYSGLTLSLSQGGFQDIKAMIKVFRRDVLERVRKDKDVDTVYQLNFQFFPLSRKYAEGAAG